MIRKKRDSGFTLVELLVVVSIVGTLSTIAISQYARYKATSIDAQMQSELAHARVAMEAFYEQNGHTYVGTTQSDLENWGFRPTTGSELDIGTLTATDYSLRSCVPGGNFRSYVFSTATGRIAGDSGSCS